MAMMDAIGQHTSVAQAFGKQSVRFDQEESLNPVLPFWRKRIYRHVEKFLPPQANILEINAGTGIDAFYLAGHGHKVHATDASPAMIEKIQAKITSNSTNLVTAECRAFQELHTMNGKFDHIFSNFGGLNCTSDLRVVTERFDALLEKNGYVTLVIMPPAAPWEWLWLLKGKSTDAFRRLRKGGASAHLEGHHFMTYYFSLRRVTNAMGEKYRLVQCEGLGSISPPPSATNFVVRFPHFHQLLESIDQKLSGIPPFNRWADHLIITFQKK